MKVKEEEVFLIVLAQQLTKDRATSRSFAQSAIIAMEVTNEIMSVTGKMSKSSVDEPPTDT
jgi:hypothetical protein